MKKTLLALFALALTATAASAQTTPAAAPTPAATPNAGHAGKGPKSPAQKARRHAAKMAQELNLTADQKAKVESIFLAQTQEMAALKARYAGQGANRQAMRPEAKALRIKYDNQLKAALGADTYARYDKLRDERHDQLRAGHGPKDGSLKAKAKG